MAEWLLPGAFWGFLIVYGTTMYVVSPRATTPASFYGGADEQGRAVSALPLTLSIFISWFFAKSVTNAANPGGRLWCRRRDCLRDLLAIHPRRGNGDLLSPTPFRRTQPGRFPRQPLRTRYRARVHGRGAGCGCAYPPRVDITAVSRANAIMEQLQGTAMPAQREQLARLPYHTAASVGGHRVAIIHGDPESLAGWSLDVEVLGPEGRTTEDQLCTWFRQAGADIFACSHACLPPCARAGSRWPDARDHQQWSGRHAQPPG